MADTIRKDLYMTDDGDLSLTPPQFYEFEGEELRVESNMREVENKASLMQTVRVRLMSSDPDVPDLKYKDFCANLEDLIGLPNTKATAQLGADKITKSLTFDNLVESEDLYVRPTPISSTEMTFYVLIKDEKDVIVFELLMNLEDGVTIRRVAYDTVS